LKGTVLNGTEEIEAVVALSEQLMGGRRDRKHSYH
jgi:hypothetical protein